MTFCYLYFALEMMDGFYYNIDKDNPCCVRVVSQF
jgi:hypothetical protein